MRVFLVLVFLLSSGNLSLGYQMNLSEVTDQIRAKLDYESPGENILVAGTELRPGAKIHAFYADRNFEEIWSKDGILLEIAYEMRHEIRQSKYDGLNPEDYNLRLIEAYFKTFETNKASQIKNEPGDLASLDLLLTNAFFYLSEHLHQGKVDPSQLKGQWGIPLKPLTMDYSKLLKTAIVENDIRRNLEKLYPKFTIYKKSREVLRSLDEQTKGELPEWKKIKLDKSIKAGDTHPSIPALRERLAFWGYLKDTLHKDSRVYDSLMAESVQVFQKKNGMDSDGILGKNTVSALNFSPADLLDKAAVNLERLRWLPDTIQNLNLIVVNIANFQLDYLTKSDTVFSSKVIVGKEYTASPIFSAQMSYIVFSPYWNIPNSITRKEIIPAVRRNSDYLHQKNMEVITSSGKVVDPSSINWGSKSFPYLIRQKPGENNSLGLVKFMFPNRYSVYIHDTPARSLFDREVRAMSHGCIRLQNPAKFAQILLSHDPTWSPEKIELAMHQSSEQIVNLPQKIPVVILYLTFWADSNGEANFRPDIYNRDQEVLELLRK